MSRAQLALPVGEWALELVQWAQAAGAAGMLGFAGAYLAATVFLLPGSVLTLGAGFAYGPALGTLLVSPVSVAGATIAFLIARSAARAWVAARVARDPRFTALDAALGDRGLQLVLLLRLSPAFPFNLLNYALGLTRVRFCDYVVGSWLGMLPGTALFVYLGSVATSASELIAGRRPAAGPAEEAFYWGGLAATVLVTILIGRAARRELEARLAAARAGEATGSSGPR
ncbi:MAG: TVP38/TMEM64 family protein [Polyangiaceae bacterium]|nr:TVP38/TMEM64 family protein [Polyangiaceae bacterium]